jgi:hypothetical protein
VAAVIGAEGPSRHAAERGGAAEASARMSVAALLWEQRGEGRQRQGDAITIKLLLRLICSPCKLAMRKPPYKIDFECSYGIRDDRGNELAALTVACVKECVCVCVCWR